MEGGEGTGKHSPAHRIHACACNYDMKLQVHSRCATHSECSFVCKSFLSSIVFAILSLFLFFPLLS